MIQKLQWYDSLPRELSMRKNKLIRRNPSAVYQRDASAYASKTGNREFLEYDMPQVLRGLEEIISTVTRLHSEKKNLSEIPGKLSEFDQEYDRMGLYIGLGGLLARIITQEKEAAEEELRRQKREEEAAEERKQKKEEEAAAIVQNQASNNSTPSWQSEGGQGYS